MAKKSKDTKLTQKQIQSVKQKQNVKVIVNVPTEKKQKRKKRVKKQDVYRGVDYKAYPPQIIYPQEPLTFYTTPQKPPTSLAKSISEPVSVKSSILEDIGTVGTEGAVEILDKPTKKETLEELINVVPIRTPRVPMSLSEDVAKTKIPQSFTENINIPVKEPSPIEEINEPFGISSTEVYNEPTTTKVVKKRRTAREIRNDLELEYEQYNKKPVEPYITNKELEDMIKYEKKKEKELKKQSMKKK